MKRFLILFAASLLFPTILGAQNIFNTLRGRTCVFSEVKLRLLFHGKPLSGRRVIRRWDWNHRKYDEKFTDETGMVSFPAVFESSLSRLLPIELVIGQQLSVEIDGKEKIFWSNSKREPEPNAEYGGAPFRLTCELSEEEVLIEDYGSLMVTMCKPDDR